MARNAITDFLQTYAFWLMDVFYLEPGSAPVFTPLFGFSTITAPEIHAEVEEITEGNWYLKRKVLKSGGVGSMTLTRGVTPIDSDFYNWMMGGLSGNTSGWLPNVGGLTLLQTVGGPSPRRDFVLIHFFPRNPLGVVGIDIGSLAVGPIDIFPKVPARAFLLRGCIPSSYKSSSDFDANSSAISIQELTIEPESFDQINLASL
jgi:phage tail-like protein